MDARILCDNKDIQIQIFPTDSYKTTGYLQFDYGLSECNKTVYF